MLHSLDRVSRRVNENHFLRILSDTEGNARPTARPAGGALRAVRRPGLAVPRHPRLGRALRVVGSSFGATAYAAACNTDRSQLPCRRRSPAAPNDAETGAWAEVQRRSQAH